MKIAFVIVFLCCSCMLVNANIFNAYSKNLITLEQLEQFSDLLIDGMCNNITNVIVSNIKAIKSCALDLHDSIEENTIKSYVLNINDSLEENTIVKLLSDVEEEVKKGFKSLHKDLIDKLPETEGSSYDSEDIKFCVREMVKDESQDLQTKLSNIMMKLLHNLVIPVSYKGKNLYVSIDVVITSSTDIFKVPSYRFRIGDKYLSGEEKNTPPEVEEFLKTSRIRDFNIFVTSIFNVCLQSLSDIVSSALYHPQTIEHSQDSSEYSDVLLLHKEILDIHEKEERDGNDVEMLSRVIVHLSRLIVATYHLGKDKDDLFYYICIIQNIPIVGNLERIKTITARYYRELNPILASP